MSSGLVQGMSRLASTARMVFDVPSVISANDGLSPLPSMVSGPVKTKYAVCDWLVPPRLGYPYTPRHLVDQLAVIGSVPGLVEVVLVVQLLAFEVGQEGHSPAIGNLAGQPAVENWRRQVVLDISVIVKRETDLLEIVDTLLSLGIRAGSLKENAQELAYLGKLDRRARAQVDRLARWSGWRPFRAGWPSSRKTRSWPRRVPLLVRNFALAAMAAQLRPSVSIACRVSVTDLTESGVLAMATRSVLSSPSGSIANRIGSRFFQ